MLKTQQKIMFKKIWWFFLGAPAWIDNCDPKLFGWELISGYEGSLYKTYERQRWNLEMSLLDGIWTFTHPRQETMYCKFPLNQKEMQQIDEITGWDGNSAHSYT